MKAKLVFLGQQVKANDCSFFHGICSLRDLEVSPGISLTPEQKEYFKYVLEDDKHIPMFCVHIEKDELDVPQAETKKKVKSKKKTKIFEAMQTILLIDFMMIPKVFQQSQLIIRNILI